MNDDHADDNGAGEHDDWVQELENQVWRAYKYGVDDHEFGNGQHRAIRKALEYRILGGMRKHKVTEEEWHENKYWVIARVREVGIVSTIYSAREPLNAADFQKAFEEVKKRCQEPFANSPIQPAGRFCQ
ncbi:MAG: hypothetical protein GKS06_00265 [Acidobacteria bacterium]|nr:hypothetical protein [Acidobacteriota bacterium]